MRRLGRSALAVVGVLTLTMLIAGVVAAGGFASVIIHDDASAPSVAGEEREIRFSLLQHGVTPVDNGRVALTAVHPESGEEIVVRAISLGSGEWIARVTFPVGGDWRVGVEHPDLETSAPTAMLVDAVQPMAWLPVVLSLAAFAVASAVVTAGMLLGRRRSVVAPAPASAEG